MATNVLTKKGKRDARHRRVRAKIAGTAERPRLAVYKSNRFISVQLIDDEKGTTIASVHGRDAKGALSKQAVEVGQKIAREAKAKGIGAVVFDRGGYNYGGQVKALADAAREGGLAF